MTSKGLCQQERGADALVLVFMVEDGEQDVICLPQHVAIVERVARMR